MVLPLLHFAKDLNYCRFITINALTLVINIINLINILINKYSNHQIYHQKYTNNRIVYMLNTIYTAMIDLS